MVLLKFHSKKHAARALYSSFPGGFKRRTDGDFILLVYPATGPDHGLLCWSSACWYAPDSSVRNRRSKAGASRRDHGRGMRSPLALGGARISGLGMAIWLLALRTLPVGEAYPMLSLNFVRVTLAARFVSMSRSAGALAGHRVDHRRYFMPRTGTLTGLRLAGASVALVTYAQLAEKWGMAQLPPPNYHDWMRRSARAADAVLRGSRAAAYALSMGCWMGALGHLPLNRAYPLLGLSYALVYLGAPCCRGTRRRSRSGA